MKFNPTLLFQKFGICILTAIFLALAPYEIQACRIRNSTPPSPNVDEALKQVTSVANDFGLRLYKEFAKSSKGKRQFFSPFSIFAALAMVSEGASGNTLTTVQHALHLPDEATLHAGIRSLNNAFSTQDDDYILSVANAIWPDASANVKPSFLETIRNTYLGRCEPLDLRGKPESARETINSWVEQQTHDRIVDLLPSGSIDPSASMIITNAIYFNGKWEREFDEKNTKVEPFFPDAGPKSTCSLMYQPNSGATFRYTEFNGVQVVELPYFGDDLSMVVLLPQRHRIAALEKNLDAKEWDKIREYLHPQLVNVWLPSFKMDIGLMLNDHLAAIGLEDLFQPGDFSGMFDSPWEFKISSAIHKSFVEVNEEGTEAAAATAFGMVEITSVNRNPPRKVYDFRADHPFLFVIQHNASGAILFMGKVVNPLE